MFWGFLVCDLTRCWKSLPNLRPCKMSVHFNLRPATCLFTAAPERLPWNRQDVCKHYLIHSVGSEFFAALAVSGKPTDPITVFV
jgi:hypothetical protein